MAKSDIVTTVLTGAETIEKGVEILVKKYGKDTAMSMLERGEYDVLYRQSRREVTSERRKEQKARMDRLEVELAKRDRMMQELQAKLDAKV